MREPMTRFLQLAAVAAVTLIPSAADAQRAVTPRADSSRRVLLEQRVRERTTEVLQQRLGLSAQQMQRLAPIRERNEQQRRTLLQAEREARTILRAELAAGDSANQARVGQQLDRLMTIQRDRLALVEQEQRALAEFMTPVQRARYQGMRESVGRRMVVPAQRGRAAGAGRPGAPGRPRGQGAPGAPRSPGA